jgi:two-component system chemotaxis response regulator CheY
LKEDLLEVKSDPRKRGFGKTVLVVDDNAPVRKTLATAFLSDGFKTCSEAENGTEAVELAQKIKPDLITMDLSMPGVSGLVAASALRKLFPRVPIILYTLYASKLLEIEAAKAGISIVLSKTAPLCTLIDIANEMVG